MDRRLRVVVLASGEGTNFEALVKKPAADYTVVALGTDNAESPALRRAKSYQVPNFTIDKATFSDKQQYDRALASILSAFQPDFVALAGYMSIVGPLTLETFRDRIINIHPSLLPRFPGLNTHARVIASGYKFHGATVHVVTQALDSGPIIVQGSLRVNTSDTAETLATRVKFIEYKIYPLALSWLARRAVDFRNGRLQFNGVDSGPIFFEDV